MLITIIFVLKIIFDVHTIFLKVVNSVNYVSSKSLEHIASISYLIINCKYYYTWKNAEIPTPFDIKPKYLTLLSYSI